MRHRRRHAGVAGLHETVADHGARDMRAVAVRVHPEVGVFSGGMDEVDRADALAVRGDVQVVGVQAGVHDGDGNRTAAGAAKEPGRAVVNAHGIRAKTGNHGVVYSAVHAHGRHGQREVGGDDGLQAVRIHIRRVGAGVRVEAPDLGAQCPQGIAEAPVGIACHQGDEHRMPFVGAASRFLQKLARHFAQRRHDANAIHRVQLQQSVQPRLLGGQLDARQASGAAEHRDSARTAAGQIVDLGAVRQTQPAEHPVAL